MESLIWRIPLALPPLIAPCFQKVSDGTHLERMIFARDLSTTGVRRPSWGGMWRYLLRGLGKEKKA